MKIRLHIDRVLVDGLPIAPSQAPYLRGVIEAELARLLDSGGLGYDFGSGTLARLSGSGMRVAPGASVDDIGAAIAGATYGSLFPGGPAAESRAPGGKGRG